MGVSSSISRATSIGSSHRSITRTVSYLSNSSGRTSSMTQSMRKQSNEVGMEIKPIKTAADHAAALAEIEGLMDAELGTPEGDRLDVLATLVEAYEARYF